MNLAPAIRDVVLVGGGHSHVILIRMWAMQPIPGVRLTLVSEKVNTPYSGMLPGLIAGHYSESDVHIDLARLCSWANVRFIEQCVSKISLDTKTIGLSVPNNSASTGFYSRPDIAFDLLSLDTGSTPQLSVSGAKQFSVPVKPVHGFYQRWQSVLARVSSRQEKSTQTVPTQENSPSSEDSSGTEPISIGVVGSGAGGFELVMAMRHAMSENVASCHWIIRGERVLKNRPESVSDRALRAAQDAGVVIHTAFDVVDVQRSSVHARDGRNLHLDEIVWCTAAKAPSWPEEAGLKVDERGFVLTNAHLQSVNAEFVFATGDIGTQQNTPSDKAGVFAVRQAPVLFQNIRRYLLGKNLKVYRPQNDFLSLMATGKKSAIGNRSFLTVQGTWVWHLKDAIDQKFMNQFRHLPIMKAGRGYFKVPRAILRNSTVSEEEASSSEMRCHGCGAKVGATILDSVLQEINSVSSADVVSDSNDAGDAAVVLTDSRQLVQSVDQITAVCDDPYVFGRIAAVHALSDVVAAGASAHSAQVLVGIPFADQRIVKRDLQQLMSGVVDALNEDECSLIGGHTSEDASLRLGFVVNGFRSPHSSVQREGVKVGDQLVLSKPIGTGVVLAGMMQRLAAGSDVQLVLNSMLQSNRVAATVLYQNGAKQVTDVTGFGLLGHLLRLLEPHNAGAVVDLQNVPVFNGAMALTDNGVASTLLEQNQHVLEQVSGDGLHSSGWRNLLCDPQTSGGLLAVVPASQSDEIVIQLRNSGYESACVVGSIIDHSTIQLRSDQPRSNQRVQ